VVLAALLPAHGDAAKVVSAAAKMAIALLFFLYGARLSPQQAWHGVRQWRLHLLVLAITFVIFPARGLAARALVPSMLTIDLYNGLLFLWLVPSTVGSSIAFTSIARGHVSAAIVSGAPRVDGTAIRDIVLQLLLPFGAGQLARPWIAGVIARHAALLKVVDRGSILLVVYTAFSMGVVEGIWASVDVWRLISLTIVAAVLRAVVLAITTLIGRLSRLDRGDAIVLLFCGSKKESGVGAPDGAGVLPGRDCRADHVAAHDLSPDPTGGVRSDRQQTRARG
jgi:sodium/bile acid cotransporter 7